MIPSLYIHIPFCKQKCNYCDFVSYSGKEIMIDDYVAALIKETKPLLSTFNFQLSTIFFGGGTPTLLKPKHFETILTALAPLPPSLEITIEANPGTADLAKLKALRSLGINRLSIGVQSFNDKHLKTLGRIHDAETAKRFYRDARAAGFDNINLDLIFALPGQTLEEWQSDLRTALELQPEHLSTYNLQIEEGTPFGNKYETQNSKFEANSKSELPNEDAELAMYESAIDTLTAAGYKHYEISNFAKPGRECQHNLTYWKNENYLGIGAGAHSHVNGRRWSNPNCIEEYLQPEETAKFIRRFPSVPDKGETIFLGLRLLDGLAKDKFAGFEKEVAELIKDGLLIEKNENFRLTRKGLYLANQVFVKFV